MPAKTWSELLQDATDEHAVIEAAKDFVASFDRHELAALPEDCRPGKFFDANDITGYAFTLVRADCGNDANVQTVVHRLASFFSEASIKLSQIMVKSNEHDSQRSA